MQEPLVSIITPCYNQGIFINETIQSVLEQSYPNIEMVIVNDGSTDNITKGILGKISHPKIKIIHTDNQGLPEARNTAIRNSNGKYILPLDADDKIAKDYISTAVPILDYNEQVSLVYGRAEHFDEKKGEWILEEFELNKMIFYNQIYPAGIYRRTDFDKIGGYDKGMLYGWEDWEFWLSLIELGGKVHFINDIVFYYRVRGGSMVRSMTNEQKKYLRQRVYTRHSKLYEELFSDPISLYYNYSYYKKAHDKLLSNKIIYVINYLSKKMKL